MANASQVEYRICHICFLERFLIAAKTLSMWDCDIIVPITADWVQSTYRCAGENPLGISDSTHVHISLACPGTAIAMSMVLPHQMLAWPWHWAPLCALELHLAPSSFFLAPFWQCLREQGFGLLNEFALSCSSHVVIQLKKNLGSAASLRKATSKGRVHQK